MKTWNEKRYYENLENMQVIERMYSDSDFAKIAYRQGLKHLANHCKTLPSFKAIQSVLDGEKKPVDIEDFRQEFIMYLLENITDWHYGQYQTDDGKYHDGIVFDDETKAQEFWSTFARVAESQRHQKTVKDKDGNEQMTDVVFSDIEQLTEQYDTCPELYYKEVYVDYMHKLNRFIESECNDIQAHYIKCVVSGRMQDMTYKQISEQTGISQKILKYWHKKLKNFSVPEKRIASNKRVNGHVVYNGESYVNTLDKWLPKEHCPVTLCDDDEK